MQSIQIVDGHITLRNPVQFGAAHIPTDYQSLAQRVAVVRDYPALMAVNFASISWIGREPTLYVTAHHPQLRTRDRRLVLRFAARPQLHKSAYNLFHGHIYDSSPTRFISKVHADRFAFQELSGVINGLKNIAIESSLNTLAEGILHALGATLRFASNGGGIAGRMTFDTSIPGWHGKAD